MNTDERVNPLSRRQFLKYAGALALTGAAGLAGCLAPAPTPAPLATPVPVRETVIVTRLVEATRLIERIVEVTKVAPLPTATPTPEEKKGMIWYVDIEHEKVLNDPQRSPDHFRVRDQRAWVMSDIAGVPCEAIHYTKVSKALAAEQDVRAIAISGNTSDWEEYDFATFQPFFEIVKAGRTPVIGLCGGHQLIGLMFGAECGALRKLKPGEQDPEPSWAAGYYKEVGYKPVRIVKDDPLFAGLPTEPIFFESHYWEVKQLPADFELLASTDDCRVQVMKHTQYLIYGIQFHPEVNSAEHADGRALLANFYRIAGVLKS